MGGKKRKKEQGSDYDVAKEKRNSKRRRKNEIRGGKSTSFLALLGEEKGRTQKMKNRRKGGRDKLVDFSSLLSLQIFTFLFVSQFALL